MTIKFVSPYVARAAERAKTSNAPKIIPMTTPKLNFGKLIYQARIASGMRQMDLAAVVGVSSNAIREIESGNVNPKLSTVGRLINALGIPEFEIKKALS